MFLNKLTSEQKELFLDLCIFLSNADGNFSDAEKLSIEQYCNEMNISDVRYETSNKFEDIVDLLCEKTSAIEKKIIVFEILALALADSEYSESEKKMVNTITSKFDISDTLREEMVTIIQKLTAIYVDVNAIVLG